MAQTLDAVTVRAWCGLALEALGQAREGIDAINVYPVADGDTGTNLYLTVESAARAVDAVFTAHAVVPDAPGPGLPEAVRAMAHGALIGARGNSGTILAQLLRGMAEVLAAELGVSPSAAGAPAVPVDAAASAADGEALRHALRRAAQSAYQAVARPVEGTVLTVAAAAADAGERAEGGAAEVARAAYEGARTALEGTPGQLDVLARAGVVDAGGCGLVTVLGSLLQAVTGKTAMGPIGAALPHYAAPPVAPPRGASYGPAGETPAPSATTARGGGVELAPTARHDHAAAPATAAAAAGSVSVAASGASGFPGEGPVPAAWSAQTAGTPAGTVAAQSGPGVAESEGRGPDEGTCATAAAGTGAVTGHLGEDTWQGPAYEVIYLLEASDDAVRVLRARLDALGDSLVVVGGDGLWNVHVHVDDAGAAVEAGVDAGRPYRIRITHFAVAAVAGAGGKPGAPRVEHERVPRAVVAVVPGEGLAALCREAGATVVTARPDEPPASGELMEAIRRAHAREVVLLPNDPALRHTAAAAVQQARAEGMRIALIPTRSSVQGIAALAVHEPDRRFDEDVVAMTSAAGATRYAELAVAERQSWTTAGVCEAGDILGMIDGDVAVIGADLAGTAVAVLDRMLAAGGEMVTLVLGSGVPDDLADMLQTHVRDAHLAVDTVVYRGGQPSVPLLIGVE